MDINASTAPGGGAKNAAGYLMESDDEARRLDLKTDPDAVKRQACWAGVRPGLRVADLGCGSGLTSFLLNEMVQPAGEVVGVDNAAQRIAYARANYTAAGLAFVEDDVRGDLAHMGSFDLVWVRFVLEYYRRTGFDIVRNVARLLKPGGILCLIDLDYNCLSHYGIPDRLEAAIRTIQEQLAEKVDFDAYAGRKLYAHLYDLGYADIAVHMEPHHLIFGRLKTSDAFNWTKKVEAGMRLGDDAFKAYDGGRAEFFMEFQKSFAHPRRFTYTPVICCRGRKPPY